MRKCCGNECKLNNQKTNSKQLIGVNIGKRLLFLYRNIMIFIIRKQRNGKSNETNLDPTHPIKVINMFYKLFCKAVYATITLHFCMSMYILALKIIEY